MTDKPVMLIAGASGSIGAAVAREAARAGWALALHGRSGNKIAALVDELPAAHGIVGDMWQDGAAQDIVAEAAAQFGRIDAVVDCVSTGRGKITGYFPDTAPEDYTGFYDLSAAWFQRLAHAAYPHLKAKYNFGFPTKRFKKIITANYIDPQGEVVPVDDQVAEVPMECRRRPEWTFG